MSISMRDVLTLPCMREAQVLAGASGLGNVVSAVSVLEYTEPTELQEELFRNLEYMGSELIITAFANVKDSVEDQCNVIRRLSATGDVGILLYYVGLFLKNIDQRVIDVADELGFVIVCMPKNQYNLRYSEAIAEIQNAIYRDRNKSTYFVPEVLDKVSSLAVHQRSVDSLLRIISDRLHLTVIVTDTAWHLLHFASWPSLLERDILTLLDGIMAAGGEQGAVSGRGGEGQYFRCFRIKSPSAVRLNLIVTGTGEKLRQDEMEQIVEAVQLFLKMWNERQDNFGVLDFIRAVIRDEPVKMRQLARSLNIDEASIHNMLLFKPLSMTVSDYRRIMEIVRENLSRHCRTLVMDIYDDCVLVFLDDGVSGQWIPTLKEIKGQVEAAGVSCRLMYSCDLGSTTEVRNAYIGIAESLDVAMKLYPRASLLSSYEIRFAGQCQAIIDKGEEVVGQEMRILRILSCADKSLERELHETLAVFYFDAHMKVAETAGIMYLHKNTIKYRLKKIAERLGCGVTEMPEMLDLYRALALERLLEK